MGWCLGPARGGLRPDAELPDEVVEATRAKYVEAFERLTGLSFDAYLADPTVVLA